MPYIDKDTAAFIKAHQDDDVRRLALKTAGGGNIDMPFALDQIAGRQTARRKLPSWAAIEGIIYPSHLSMEQCSGEQAARYKAAVAARLAGGGRLVDITGGFGVDFSFMARGFSEAVYVERQQLLCDIAEENFRVLGLTTATIVNGDGTEYLKQMDRRAAVIFVDPARRDAGGGRTFAISDCTPDVLAIMDMMLERADHVIIKLSPMLDWRKAVADIGTAAREVHIVATGNECKELLIVASRHGDGTLRVYCANDGDVLEFTVGPSAATATPPESGAPTADELKGAFLYEPNVAIMKAGCFGLLEQRYGTRQIGPGSHLFVSASPVSDFPGRRFHIEAVTSMNKRELRDAMAGIDKANITTRNFPMTVAELRKRLKKGEGGGTYIFATTLAGHDHVLIICTKAV